MCSNFIKLDLSNFNTKNITYMSAMFYDCSSLRNIDLSNFNTRNVKDICLLCFVAVHL